MGQLLLQQRFAPFEGALLDGYDVVVCDACGFCFADGIPEQVALDLYYRRLSKYENPQRGGRPSGHDLRRQQRTAEALTPWIASPDARILEVGCSTGTLLHLLREGGFPEVSGWDPSAGCAAAAKQLYDIDVRAQTLADPGPLDRPFDLVILIGVLEHVRDLAASLDLVRALLAETGFLYVDVPDATRFAEYADAPFQQFSAEHVNFFSEQSLSNLLATAGFEPVWCHQGVEALTALSPMPNVTGLFRLTADGVRPRTTDVVTRGSLAAYVGKSRAIEGELLAVIDGVVGGGEPLIVWGVGTLTRRLMATSRLPQANIHAFADSNIHYHGQSFAGIEIIAPSAVCDRTETVLVASVYQVEIERQMRDVLGCTNPIVHLLPGTPARSGGPGKASGTP
jgi:SAM-dependent methyltransferase